MSNTTKSILIDNDTITIKRYRESLNILTFYFANLWPKPSNTVLKWTLGGLFSLCVLIMSLCAVIPYIWVLKVCICQILSGRRCCLSLRVNKSESAEAEQEGDVRLSSGLSSDQSGNLFSHRCQHVLMIVEPGQAVPP